MPRSAPTSSPARGRTRSADRQSSSEAAAPASRRSQGSEGDLSGDGFAETVRLADDLRRIGLDAGLDAVGICDASPFSEARRALDYGLDQGWDAGMQFTYRKPARSTDPNRLMDGASSMVVGALRYDRALSDPQSPDPDRPRGRVARYAWRDNYRELRSALEEVADHLRSEGWRATVVADDNAMVDRAAAVRAGIGWYGKNTNVLIPGAGSWFVLGSVVTDAPLIATDRRSRNGNRPLPEIAASQNQDAIAELAGPKYDASTTTLTPGPVDDGCGTCRRCIDACPTGALSHDRPGHLDAGKCLAWLVQAPGVFPREHRVALGDRMYGCDDCQDACPVNRLAARKDPPPPERSTGAEATISVDIHALLEADNRELLGRFGRWYIPKRDPKYLRRNALIVLGNTADPTSPRTRAAISKAIDDPDPIIRTHAVWSAARLGYTDLIPEADPEPMVQEEAEAARTVPSRARR